MPAVSRADTSVIGRWWWSVDRVTLLALAVLIGIGYVLALAATPGISMHVSDPHTMAMIKQILFLGAAGEAGGAGAGDFVFLLDRVHAAAWG
jgi:cell division protein FtsW